MQIKFHVSMILLICTTVHTMEVATLKSKSLQKLIDILKTNSAESLPINVLDQLEMVHEKETLISSLFLYALTNALTTRWQTNNIFALSFSPHNKQLASGSCNGEINLWNPVNGTHLQTLSEHTKSVQSLFYNQKDETQLLSGSYDQTVKLWDIPTGKCITTLQGHTDKVMSISMSSDGKELVSGSYDQTAKLWDMRTAHCVTTREAISPIRTVCYHPHGTQIAYGAGSTNHNPFYVSLYDLRAHTTYKTFYTENLLHDIKYSYDGKKLVQGFHCYTPGPTNSTRNLGICNVDENPSSFGYVKSEWLYGHSQAVVSVAVSPDNMQIASASWDHTVQLRDIASKNVYSLRYHDDSVHTVCYSPNGELLASGARNGYVVVLNLALLKEPRMTSYVKKYLNNMIKIEC